MIDPEDSKYYLNLISISKTQKRFYLNLIDKETKNIKYPIIIEPKMRRPKIDSYMEIFHKTYNHLPIGSLDLRQSYTLNLKNPFY